MKMFKAAIFSSILLITAMQYVSAEVDSSFHCYLLFGQSNMAGGAAGQYDGEGTKGVDDYCDTNSRVKVLAWGDCDRDPYPCPHMRLTRTHDEWYTAFPPYHNCHEGIGPADGFGRTLLDSIHESITIGFIPCALSGEPIEVFQKGSGRTIAGHTQPTIGNGQKLTRDAYGWMVKRCKIAQETGVIKGILLHQGESNNGDGGWPGKVKGIINDLKKDLGLWDSIPVVAGEMRYDGCCGSFNKIINTLPNQIPNCLVSSAEGVERRLSRPDGGYDQYHFSTAGEKLFGYRYGVDFLKLADSDWVPRKGDSIPTPTIRKRERLTARELSLTNGPLSVYTLDGQLVVQTTGNNANIRKHMPSGKIYIVKRTGRKERTDRAIPFVCY